MFHSAPFPTFPIFVAKLVILSFLIIHSFFLKLIKSYHCNLSLVWLYITHAALSVHLSTQSKCIQCVWLSANLNNLNSYFACSPWRRIITTVNILNTLRLLNYNLFRIDEKIWSNLNLVKIELSAKLQSIFCCHFQKALYTKWSPLAIIRHHCITCYLLWRWRWLLVASNLIMEHNLFFICNFFIECNYCC